MCAFESGWDPKKIPTIPICHSVPDLLYVCGFFWEGAGGKGKGRGKDARKRQKGLKT